MALSAIIFDMDGVIADTEYLDYQLQTDFVKHMGGTQDAGRLSALMGKSYGMLHSTMKELIGSSDTPDEIGRQYAEYIGDVYERTDYTQYFRSGIIPILDYADDNGIKLAVASSSTKEHIATVLRQCGIYERFQCITSGEDMAESKPNPAIYKHTLHALGVSAENAVAIEDSPSGIASAKGAGLRVIAYREQRMAIDQSQADFMGGDMEEIFAIIMALNG